MTAAMPSHPKPAPEEPGPAPETPVRPVTILVALHGEGSDIWQTTTGVRVAKNLYELLPTPDYDPADDWEFTTDRRPP